MIEIYIIDLIKVGKHVYSNVQSKSQYLQFHLIRYISNADEQ